METVWGAKLTVDVPQLATAIAEEEPPADAVVESAQVQEHEQDPDTDLHAVVPEQPRLVRGEERQLARQPAGEQEDGQQREEGGILNHERGSSNA